ncbi:MAG: ribulose-phosphate 3-epimerase [Gaiellaceae bacterium]
MAVISASILDADFSRLRAEVERVAEAGVDAFSLDVIDGHFAPRISFGEYIVALVRNWTVLPIEVHLMVERPERLVQRMSDAGADLVLFHLEATDDPQGMVERVRSEGRCVGVAVKEDTPIDAISDELLGAVDVVNLLSVPIGFGGSPSAPDTLERIAYLRQRADALGIPLGIEVDGGVKPTNAGGYVEAGADMLTVGTGIYHAADPVEAVQTLTSSTAGPADAVARRRLHAFLDAPSRTPKDDAARRARLEELRVAQDIPRRVWDPLRSPR